MKRQDTYTSFNAPPIAAARYRLYRGQNLQRWAFAMAERAFGEERKHFLQKQKEGFGLIQEAVEALSFFDSIGIVDKKHGPEGQAQRDAIETILWRHRQLVRGDSENA